MRKRESVQQGALWAVRNSDKGQLGQEREKGVVITVTLAYSIFQPTNHLMIKKKIRINFYVLNP